MDQIRQQGDKESMLGTVKGLSSDDLVYTVEERRRKKRKFHLGPYSQESSGLCKRVQNSLHRWEKPAKRSLMARAAVGSFVGNRSNVGRMERLMWRLH